MQISNYRRVENKKNDNVLYSVMLECKLCQGTKEAFVRDVKAAPEPQCILCFDSQIADMERFLSSSSDVHGILTVDPTYNLGEFYVTPTTYPHLMLEDVITGKPPSLLGPVLIHQKMAFSTFNYFSSTLVGFSKKLRQLAAFGTDGQESLIDAFSHSFPFALQLRCFIHFKKNISEKLKVYGIPPSVAKEFLDDIFGKHSGSTYSEGLVDCSSVEEFNERLAKCESVWNSREVPYAPPGGPRFFDYFCSKKADVVRYNMRRDLRESAGLGSPPGIFTTNASESINSMMKRKVSFKESEWPHFNDQVKELVKQQREEVIRALSGRGQYRLSQQFSHFSVSAAKWAKMRPEQRREIIMRFDKATMKTKQRSSSSGPSTIFSLSTSEVSCGQQSAIRRLSVTAVDSGITKISPTTLQNMWDKAEELMNDSSAITPAPGKDKTARIVLSYSSAIPHLVLKGTNGQFKCDSRCLNWRSSKLCSHSLAVAELNNELPAFLHWFNQSDSEPNITSLAMAGLPPGRGCKGGVPKRTRQREKEKMAAPEISIPRPIFQPTCLHRSPSITSASGHVNVCSQAGNVIQVSGTTPGNPTSSIVSTLYQAMNVITPSSVGQVKLSNICSHASNVTSPATSASMTPAPSQPNLNPFYVKFIYGNIRMCQGCRSPLRLTDGSIPAPPFDLVMARVERRTFRD